MNSVLFLTSVLAAVCLSMAVSPEYQRRFVDSMNQCAHDLKLEMKDIVDGLLPNGKFPSTKEMKCAIGCFFEKMGYVTDMKLDWAKFRAVNHEKFEDKEDLEKLNKLTDNCAKAVTETFSDICDLGVPTLKCLHDEAEKLKLGMPEVNISV